ncbi:SAV_915 family protein [Streptomyces sp. NPDC015130]|uniref:SAV_915 family protein n=1 Tax=Streptomyces sp. NPDC015130 TaxID=3364940 RepID=UPI0036FF2632
MTDALFGDDAEPFDLPPAAGRLCVPVRPSAGGWATRLFRTPVGGRTAVAFTDPARLRTVLGAAQPWILLSEPALRALTEPLGVHELRIDPAFTAPAPVATATPAPSTTTPVAGPRPLTALAS